ncbi:MAG: type II toxin-antitoxin system VapC family toxin [Verrucomicrobiota bacterium]|jgi:predicted nucleic acid-binding protein
MKFYADTSLLISYYINESNSARAQSLIHATAGPLPFTGLHRLEMRNALGLGLFRHVLTPAQINAAWSDIERDLRAGRLLPQPINWLPVFRAAAQWAAIHSPKVGCRSLDVLHVATARKLDAVEFITFDARQKALAQALGLSVKS